ncbi:ABC transporter permease subunit [Auraticoccus sp. F435]|uniref:ABC transporter permease subunit n=1 Tax=Auraticoccus cholistanensis TaxID=2656650 RepID=A0A6A9V1E2_9ACTN|nr:carbohydrate ABC transporter permease [Auraticoccus cholistanensis]MVA77249.1 ABC transporter permease subunit [Auraticoccus cholistanensis]
MTTTALSRRRRVLPDRPATRIRESSVDRVFLVAVYLLLGVFVLAVLLPLVYIVASSFSSPAAVSSGRVFLWPVDFTLQGYEVVLTNPEILTGYVNSLIYAVAGTFISTTLTVAIAYPLSRRGLVGSNLIMALVLVTMLFTGGLIPTYLVVQELGMLNTRWALLLPQAIAVWQVIIARTYFRSAIPDELAEAAELDGSSDLRFLWSVVLPLSKPMIAVVALMYAITQWNSYFDALIYLKDPDLYPLQLVLRNILILNSSAGGGVVDVALQMQREQMAELLKYSLIVVASIPVLLIYPFVARHFTKGVMIGAVKG